MRWSGGIIFRSLCHGLYSSTDYAPAPPSALLEPPLLPRPPRRRRRFGASPDPACAVVSAGFAGLVSVRARDRGALVSVAREPLGSAGRAPSSRRRPRAGL